ncbi:NAD(P)H-quinone oxidoreductase subunit S, chloroplastic [Andrographis paniculata]|uniref:NAD(P)H-quinone oxidoreductase subunit S, chloroplastic n=1 Tax=Andrographis paniculata TaxID=175694 RepID=UPI0021E890A6|nr:NAD(P)H-quinone oxidoreductase subunit S, chloroplastic [Andrographis paniculata]
MAAAAGATAAAHVRRPILHKSEFLGSSCNFNTTLSLPKSQSQSFLHRRHVTTAKFNLYEILGGRGLCNGEEGIDQELKKTISAEKGAPPNPPASQQTPPASETSEDGDAAAFGKELMGMTGGFPGGERGLEKFIQENPPPAKKGSSPAEAGFDGAMVKKPKPPELPMLLPGMIAIVKNPNNPFYMYCGIVQRITDGKAGVLFEGGNWDRLVTFRLEELERREKGPPMVNPKSAILEEMVQQKNS